MRGVNNAWDQMTGYAFELCVHGVLARRSSACLQVTTSHEWRSPFKDGDNRRDPTERQCLRHALPQGSIARLQVAYNANGLVMRMSRIPAAIHPLR